MKKKKISKFGKILLLFCMIFSQVASPIKVLADEIVPSYNLELVVNSDDDYVITSNGTKELDEEKTYILETVRSFTYVDGTVKDDVISYEKVLGSVLNTGVVISHNDYDYNGVALLNIRVYDVKNEEIDLSTYTEEDYKLLLTTEDVEKIMETSFEKNITDNLAGLTYEVTGDNVLCEENKCIVSVIPSESEVTTNEVNISYTFAFGDTNPDKVYRYLIYVNDTLVDSDVLGIDSVNFLVDYARVLGGVYNIRFDIIEEETNNKITSESIEFTYETEDVVIKDYFDNIDDIRYAVFSYSVLTEEERVELGNEYRYLDNMLAYVFDSSLENSDIYADYNLFDDNNNRYHVIGSSNFTGVFVKNENTYTVANLYNELNELQLDDLKYSVTKNNELVSEDALLENGMVLNVNYYGEVLSYDLLVYGEVDGGLVEESDLSAFINKLLNNNISFYDYINLDINGDDKIDIKDISLLGYNVYVGEYTSNILELTDNVTPSIVSNTNELYVGESFEVTLMLSGFDNDYINLISGLINYDKDVLALTKIELLNEEFVGNSLDNRFIYASIDSYNANKEGLVRLTFTALKEGLGKVSVSDVNLLADGNSFGVSASNTLEIKVNRLLHTNNFLSALTSSVGNFDKVFDSNVLDYTLYVDSWVSKVTINGVLSDEFATTDGFREYALTGDNTKISINVTAENGEVRTYAINVVKVYKSSNNNLSNIIISGYEIDFNKDILEYNIEVGSDVDSLDISAIVEDGSAWAKIEGNENFKEGKNEVRITVYAQDGTTKTYKLIVNKKAKVTPVVDDNDDEIEVTDNKTEKVIIIILIILVVLGLLYLIFKKDDEDEPVIQKLEPKKDNSKNDDKPRIEQVKNNNNKNKKKK